MEVVVALSIFNLLLLLLEKATLPVLLSQQLQLFFAAKIFPTEEFFLWLENNKRNKPGQVVTWKMRQRIFFFKSNLVELDRHLAVAKPTGWKQPTSCAKNEVMKGNLDPVARLFLRISAISSLPPRNKQNKENELSRIHKEIEKWANGRLNSSKLIGFA